MDFSLQATDGQARAGRLHLARGVVETPVYMPVGTQGAIRALPPELIRPTRTQILLANTYHLSQRPGADLVAKHGGLHDFMQVDLPILTDSGGFQVYSLKPEVSEDGVAFRYEVDGKRTVLTPEISMELQQKLGADIAMVFDECLPFGVDRAYAEDSLARTHRWEARCKVAHTRPDQSLFGIVQGGFWPDLRERSAYAVREIGFDGYAIGGLSVGEGPDVMKEVLDATTPHMSPDHPRYLMGVGRPQDLVEGVARGIDMFDCVIQTRHARSGMLYTSQGRLRITDRRYRNDMYPIDTSCDCATCSRFTRAYVHHLFRVGEILGTTLATVHNIHWFHRFMRDMRQSIIDGTFETFRKGVHQTYPEVDDGPPAGQHEVTGSKRAARRKKRKHGRKG
ncbi:MAG: tRNA guanosine(34) transglycosylase Tgt [Deltaproteobacteria bacterium]|nr:MAG: tRNA guanosine(34) transglycosylase Tgt [Deltaproteobacteria bacterium]